MDTSVTERLLALLQREAPAARVLQHAPVRTSAEAARVRGTALEQGAKALLFEADGTPALVVVPAHLRVDSRAVKARLGAKDLRLASPARLAELTGLEPGGVPPFGSLLGLPTYVDGHLLARDEIAFNAGSRRTSVVMSAAEYARIERPTVGAFAKE